MQRGTHTFLIGFIVLAAALGASSAETKVEAEAEIGRHAHDAKGLYEITFQMTPRLFSEFILPLIKDHQARPLGYAELDTSPWLKPIGISSPPGAGAIANHRTDILTFINSGDQIPLICELMDPVVCPRSFRRCDPSGGPAADH